MSVLFCDSNCELDYKKFDELDMKLIKMPYLLDGELLTYDLGRDGEKIPTFYKRMRQGAVAKTQGLIQFEYVEYFDPVLASGQDVLYITFSHKMSGTFNAMRLAIEELEAKYPNNKVKYVDSMHISMGTGIIVYEAGKLHASGASDDEIIDFVKEFAVRTKTYFTVGDLEYLRRGGRVTKFKAAMGNFLNLKPMLYINPLGELENFSKVKGRKKSLVGMADFIDPENIDLNYPCSIINADCQDDANFLKEILLERFPSIEIFDVAVGPVIGAHCGPDTVGLIFVNKKA